jgi:hypothetical protein
MTFRSSPTGKSDRELLFLCRPTSRHLEYQHILRRLIAVGPDRRRPQASWTISHAYRMHVQKEFLILSPMSDLVAGGRTHAAVPLRTETIARFAVTRAGSAKDGR